MSELAKNFRADIADFVGRKKSKGPAGKSAPASAKECVQWLSSSMEHVSRLRIATHVLKAGHPQAKGSNWNGWLQMRDRPEIGTHTVAQIEEDVLASSASYLGAASFLRLKTQGQRVLDWVKAGDKDFQAALHEDPDTARAWMRALHSLACQLAETPVSHPLAKQVYWPENASASPEGPCHVLQPLFPSSLAHAVYTDIRRTRFGKDNAEARDAFMKSRPFDKPYHEYQGLALRKLGGSKPLNVSLLNGERDGRNDLLASLPPPAWKTPGLRLLEIDSVFAVFLYFGNVRSLVDRLGRFLASDPDAVMQTRQRCEYLVQELGLELAAFGAAVRNQQKGGWTRDERCHLPRHQQLWLDQERALLSVRDGHGLPVWEDDSDFKREYHLGDWADQVAGDFGKWLNARLRSYGEKLQALDETEMRHFACQAVIEVAWPAPMRRRAPAGDIT